MNNYELHVLRVEFIYNSQFKAQNLRLEEMIGKLVLEDGTVFTGESFGYEKSDGFLNLGEIVFNTSMSGYQEILTDPSYCQQIVTMTYPLIGNYGVNDDDFESKKVQVAGFVVREYSAYYSNFRATKSLDQFLKEQQIPAIQGIDTRCLTRLIREKGALRSVIAIGDWDNDLLLKKVSDSPKMEGLNLVEKVTTQKSFTFSQNDDTSRSIFQDAPRYNIVAVDFGIKTNILRMLTDKGCLIKVVSAHTPSEEILKLKPDAVFLSNGPGDPAAVEDAIKMVQDLLSEKPIFGICLGHQILALALGAKTYKLKFGHRGGNHPVKNLLSDMIEITSQNHGFTVDQSSLPSDIEITHINLNDHTVEGIRHKSLPVFSVQYHPESSPGPHDSGYLFDQFIQMIQS